MAAAAPHNDVARPPCWRVLVAVPPGGFGRQLAIMRAWLDAVCGPAGWCLATAAAGVGNAVAFDIADRDAARAFIGRFGCGYRPSFPHRI